jgi:Tol biopolymer transport system component
MAPDGTKLLIARFDPVRGARDLWILDTTRGTKTRLTSTPADEAVGPFTPDGAEILFDTDARGAFAIDRLAVDGLSEPKLLLADSEGLDWQSYDVSPDGRTLAAAVFNPSRSNDAWLVPLAAPEDRRPWLATDFNELGLRFSPDGAWLAFESDRSGRDEVYVRRVSGGPLVQVSRDGGRLARFRPDGRALYFLGADRRLHEAPLSVRAGGLTPGRPRPLGSIDTSGLIAFLVAPDGRLLVVRRLTGGADSLRLLLGWRARVEREEGAEDVAGQR